MQWGVLHTDRISVNLQMSKARDAVRSSQLNSYQQFDGLSGIEGLPRWSEWEECG